MRAKCGQKSRDALEPRTGLLEPQNEIPVHSELKCFVYFASNALPDTASPEHRFLRHKVDPSCNLVIVGRKNPTADFLIGLVNNNAVTIDDIHVRVARKKGADVLKRAWQDEVVRI